MDFDLEGYLEREPLATSKPLLPLFEAVVNSIQATEDRGGKSSIIEIHIKRDQSQQNLQIDKASNPIIGFQLKDNGIGFNEENYASFNTTYSRYKKPRGGKGIGRFSWLQAFEKTEIKSIFKDNDLFFERSFTFSIKDKGVGNTNCVKTDSHEIGTIVNLENFNIKYGEVCPHKGKTIAQRILEHCLFSFLKETPPQITIIDDDEEESISLNQLYKDHIEPFSTEEKFKIGEFDFSTKHLKLYSGDSSFQHSIHLCGNDRDVKQINLSKRIPSLTKKLEDESGNSFYYLCYTKSPFLDIRVNSQRTGFTLFHDGEVKPIGEITEEEITLFLVNNIRLVLQNYIENLKKKIIKKAENLVTNQYPEYRILLKDFENCSDSLSQDIADEELLYKFNELQLKKDLQIRKDAENLIEKSNKGEFDDEYSNLFKHYLENLGDTSTLNLSKYIIHRKAILGLLKKRLESDVNGKYSIEEKVHEVIFPLRKTSDDVPFHSWNLWIVDERLSFHSYLSSDRPLSEISASESKREPDFFIINNPSAFIDSERVPLDSIVLIELKKPERKNYGDDGEDKNPIDQLTNYINRIREGKELNIKGRTITVTNNTKFYCYILADLNERLKSIATNRGFTLTPDSLGYFWHNPNNKSYMEIISFNKLLQDAEQRNLSLFKQLGLH